MFLTDLNSVWPDVKRRDQTLQKFSHFLKIGASDAPGSIHQKDEICMNSDPALERIPGGFNCAHYNR